MSAKEKVTKVFWTRQARTALHQILDYRYKDIPTARKIVRNDIIKTSMAIAFPEQYPRDDIFHQYRKIAVRDYKLLYRTKNKVVYIMNVVCMLADNSSNSDQF